MFETGRRSATSTSELGLYSDRSDHYHRNRYGIGVRKYVVGVMVVLAIILISVLLYDFTSSATVVNNGAKETKHIYILQNALKRSINSFRKTTTTTSPLNLDGNRTEIIKMEDRSDVNYDQEDDINDSDELNDQIASESRSISIAEPDPEFRSQNLNNFNLRKRLLSMDEDESEEKVQGKQLFGNHAMVYRLRQRYKYPVSDEDTSFEESRPMPFHFEYKTPVPTSFKRPKYPQLSPYRYPQSSNNIQDIIKYLTKENENPNRGIKFSGVYVNPKKFDYYPEAGEMMSNSDRSEEENASPFSYSFSSDPFHQYKPKNPSDVNLLATSNVRFSPSGSHRYNPGSYEPYFARPPLNFNAPSSPSSSESQYDNYASHTTSTFGKKRKPKPFSVMLDIYPIPESADPNRKSSRPRSGPSGPQSQSPQSEEYDGRRPPSSNKGSKYPNFSSSNQPISLVAVPGPHSSLDDEERQKMIFHLNLFPKRRNKSYRNDVVPRSHRIEEEVEEKVPAPFDSIAKQLTDHTAVQISKFEDTQTSDEAKVPIYENGGVNRYEESELELKNNSGKPFSHDDRSNGRNSKRKGNKPGNTRPIPPNHRPEITVENITSTFLKASNEELDTLSEGRCKNCKNDTILDEDSKSEITDRVSGPIDIDTVEGFQDFADGLLATD